MTHGTVRERITRLAFDNVGVWITCNRELGYHHYTRELHVNVWKRTGDVVGPDDASLDTHPVAIEIGSVFQVICERLMRL